MTAPRTAEADHKGSVTIGEGVIVHGTITATGRALVFGSLDGELTAGEVLIGPSGRVAGRLTADIVDIHGDGPKEVTAWKSLVVRATGRLSGKIQYARLDVESGGTLDGELIPLAEPSPNVADVSAATGTAL